MAEYAQSYDQQGKFSGVTRTKDGASIPADDRNRDWRAFSDWNAAQQTPLDLSDLPPPVVVKPRDAATILADFDTLKPDRQVEIMAIVQRATLAAYVQNNPTAFPDLPGAA